MNGFEAWWQKSFISCLLSVYTPDEIQAIKKGYEDCWKEAIKYARQYNSRPQSK